MPAGFHIASAWVDIHVEDGGLRREIQNAVRSAAAGAEGRVDLNVQAGELRAKVEGAIRGATAGQEGKVNLDVNSASLRGKVTSAVRSASAGQSARVGLELTDATALRVGVAAAVRAAAAGAKVKVQLDLDSARMKADVQAAMRALDRNQTITAKMDLDAAGLRAKVSAAVAAARVGQKVEVKVDVDRNSWASAQAMIRSFSQAGEAGMNGLISKLRFIPGLGRIAAGGIAVIGPAIMLVGALAMVAFNAIVLLGGALAALALPVGIIALGGFLQKATLQVEQFKTSLQGIGQSVTSSLGPAINGAMSQIIGSLGRMRGALTQMFSNAAQLVQPLTTALMGLVSNAIPGITAALGSLRSAMPGIQAGFASMGQGIGNFFRELTANGAAVGRVWATIGQGINRVLSSLGQAFSKLASNDAAVALLGQTFEALAQTITVAATATAAFAPILLQLANAFNTFMGIAGPALEMTGKLASSFSQLTQGNLGGAIGSLFGDGKSKADEFKNSIAQVPGVLSTVASTSTQTAGAVRQQADAMRRAADEAKKLDAAFGPGTSAIKERLDSAKESADALANSLSALATGAQSALGGQIDLGNAIATAKDAMSGLQGALTMSNGQLNLTSQSARDAAEHLNKVAEAGMKSAMAFAEQGNWAQAAGAIDKTRAAIVSLGQGFGLSKAQATELANQLTTFADKEYTFKLNMEGAKQGLADVKAAFDAVGKDEKVVRVTAMTDSAKAAITALGFQVKDLGNGQFEVKADTATAKASLTGLQSVLDALSNKQANVNVKADQVPAVTAALEALGMKVTTLPNGDVKVTAQDGATTVISGVKGAVDSLTDKAINLTAKDGITPPATVAKGALMTLNDRNIQLGGVDLLSPKANAAKTAVEGVPDSKNSVLNASGTAGSLAESIRKQIENIPGSKDSKLTASGDAKAKSDAVKAAIDSLPPEKQIAVLVEVSQNATSALTTLKTTLDGMNNTSIHISINILGKDGVAQVTADLKNLPTSKGVNVSVAVVGKAEVTSLKTAIDGLKSKSVNASAKASGTGEIKNLNNAINQLKSKSVTVKASVSGEGQTKALSAAINNVKAKAVPVKANVTGTAQVKALTAAINTVKAKTVAIRANVSGTGAVHALRAAIAGVNSKTVTVTVVTKKVGSAAGGGYMHESTLQGFASGGAPARNYKPGGNVVGPGTATSDEILARLSNGEFVVRAAMVRKFGHNFFTALNAGVVPSAAMAPMTRFASGGAVGSASSTMNYTVQKGDTLWALAKKFGSSVDELVRLNKIANRNLIYIGQTLRMPAKSTGKTPWGNKPLGSVPGTVNMPGYGAIPIAPGTTHYFGWAELPKGNFTGGTKGKLSDAEISGRKELIALSSLGPYAQMSGGKNSSLYHDLSNPADMNALIGTLYQARNAAQKADLKAPVKAKLLSQLDAGAAVLMRNQYQLEQINASLATATEKLTELKGQFDQLKNAVADNVREYGKITKIGAYGTSVNTLTDQLTRDVTKSATFASMLDQLKSMGLSEDLIKQIGTAGIEGGGFATAQSLINASPAEISKLNGLNEQLISNATAAGMTVAQTMYQSGIDAAQGLVDGLKAQQSQIETVMKQIAKSMEVAIKQALGIASPSKVMHKLGQWTGLGLVTGLDDKARDVIAAARNLVELPGRTTGLPSLPGFGGSTSGVSTGTISTGSGGVHIGSVHVHIDGTFDLTNPAQRREIAQKLVAEIKEEIRLSDKARAR